MSKTISLANISTHDSTHWAAIAGLWTGACGPDLAISPAFVSYTIRPTTGARHAGRFAMRNDEPVGFVLASTQQEDATVSPRDLGWIDAIAVLPEEQRRGVGRQLMDWAEGWLADQGCRQIQIGASLRPFAPGVPSAVNTLSFFTERGYLRRDGDGRTWDVAANLATYAPPKAVRPIDGVVYPGQPGQEGDLLIFLRREFGGRWRYEFEQSLLEGVRFSDYMLLWTERGVDGFCRLTFEDSERPLERFYPYRLPRPWGQLGPIGVSADRRGQGYGAAVLDAGLRRLYNNGINGCVIDWTTLVDFYGKFGFERYREYVQLLKES